MTETKFPPFFVIIFFSIILQQQCYQSQPADFLGNYLEHMQIQRLNSGNQMFPLKCLLVHNPMQWFVLVTYIIMSCVIFYV